MINIGKVFNFDAATVEETAAAVGRVLAAAAYKTAKSRRGAYDSMITESVSLVSKAIDEARWPESPKTPIPFALDVYTRALAKIEAIKEIDRLFRQEAQS